MKFYRKIFFVSTLLFSTTTNAEIVPKGTVFDGRIKDVNYNEDDVTFINVKVGVSTLIKLEEGEIINKKTGGGLGLGDPNAWSIKIVKNNIWFKPKANAPFTNVNLVTNKRTYSLILQSNKNNPVAYVVRFKYAKIDDVKQYKDYGKENNIPCNNPAVGIPVNINYQMWGDVGIAPVSVWDDGQFTCMSYPRNISLPAIYQVTADGSEMLVNKHMEGNIVVVHSPSKQYRLRLGKSVLGIKTDEGVSSPHRLNMTTIPNVYREIKDEK